MCFHFFVIAVAVAVAGIVIVVFIYYSITLWSMLHALTAENLEN